jgi:Zn-dependent protease with chaperone function
MAISVTCGQCRHSLQVKDELAGKRGKCPKCQTVIEVPAPVAVAAAVPSRKSPAGSWAAPASAGPVASARAAGMPPSPVKAALANPPATAPRPAAAAPAPQARPVAKAAPAAKSAPPATLSPEQRRVQVMSGFRGEIPRAKASLMYRLGILLTAAFMVLLPLIYVGIIALACLGMYWHVTNNYVIIGAVRGRGAFLALIVYLAPVVVGGIMILFMIKPLFARPAKEPRRRSVTPTSDPLLFEFVERICKLVRAPLPKRIDIDCDINASAGFRRGWLSVLLGSDLVLTIGLPLASGLSLQQFAGVLAHEFGHFSQGTGMRLTYVIRTINGWFVRVVYERDSWDDWLAGAAEDMDLRIGWVIYVARFGVWLTRQILWGLMFLGHIVAGFMLRQMEFDADRYETHLAGSQTFEATCRRLRLLGLAWQGAQSDLSSYYRDGRLVDNLPRLIMHNVDQVPADVRKEADEQIAKSETTWFDSHPADKDRIAAAAAEQAAGVFHSNLPATVLFDNFAAAGKNVTWDYYCAVFERTIDPNSLKPTEDLLARLEKEQAAEKACERFFAGSFTPLRPVRLPVMQGGPQAATQPPAVWQQELAQARQTMQAGAPAYCAAIETFDKADTRLIQARQARSVLMSDVRLKHDKFENPPTTGGDASLARDRAQAEINRIAGQMEAFEDAVGRRLRSALMLLSSPALAARLPEAATMNQEAQRLMPVVAHVSNHHASLLELRNCNAILVALLGHLEGNERNETLIREILDFSGRVREQLSSIQNTFSRTDYPFDHARGEISVSHYLLKVIPPPEEVGAVFETADGVLHGLFSLYARCLGRLSQFVEAVETNLGHQPLPQVKKAETVGNLSGG